MSGRELEPELLGRLAERLEESGRALKTISIQQTQLSNQMSSLQTSVDSAHARLKAIEHTVNGNGGQGLKTDLALLRKDVENAESGLKTLQAWREKLGDKKVTELQEAQKEGRSRSTQIWLAAAALLIAIGSMVGSCGPQWIKAFSDKPAVKADG